MLTKVNIIGEQAWHVFEKDGVEVKEECTVKEYDELNSPNPKNPTKEDFVWKMSYKDWKYDTVSGRLEDNCYVEVGDRFIVKLEGKGQKNVTEL